MRGRPPRWPGCRAPATCCAAGWPFRPAAAADGGARGRGGEPGRAAANGPAHVTPAPSRAVADARVPIALDLLRPGVGVGDDRRRHDQRLPARRRGARARPETDQRPCSAFGIHSGGRWQCSSAASPWRSRTRRILRIAGGPLVALFPMEMSESPWDGGWPPSSTCTRGAAVALSAAPGFAVRTCAAPGRTCGPLRIGPAHPLRDFLLIVARLRERYAPDPRRPGRTCWRSALALLLAVGAWPARGARGALPALGTDCASRGDLGRPRPHPADVVPGRWRVEGALGPDRGVTLAVTAELRNLGRLPRGISPSS